MDLTGLRDVLQLDDPLCMQPTKISHLDRVQLVIHFKFVTAVSARSSVPASRLNVLQ